MTTVREENITTVVGKVYNCFLFSYNRFIDWFYRYWFVIFLYLWWWLSRLIFGLGLIIFVLFCIFCCVWWWAWLLRLIFRLLLLVVICLLFYFRVKKKLVNLLLLLYVIYISWSGWYILFWTIVKWLLLVIWESMMVKTLIMKKGKWRFDW